MAMKDAQLKACFGIGAVVAVYAIYSFTHSSSDGYIFGTVLAAVAALAGYTVAAVKGKDV